MNPRQSRTRPAPARRLASMLLALGLVPAMAHAAPPIEAECSPPRTRVALLPLADRTDHAWAAWTGDSPAELVARLLADSLSRPGGRDVVSVPLEAGDSSRALARPADDEQSLRAAHRARAEVVLSGSVTEFTREDRREPGRLSRWGVGAADARSRARVTVTVRLLDAADGSVIIETTASREHVGRGTANVSHPEGGEPERTDPLLAQALGEVLADLVRTLDQRLDARWQARVLTEGPGLYVLDAGRSRGLFAGERLDVFRSGIQVFDEDLVRVADGARVGAVVVVGFEGNGRAHARLLEGEARVGDRVRPCEAESAPAMSLRR